MARKAKKPTDSRDEDSPKAIEPEIVDGEDEPEFVDPGELDGDVLEAVPEISADEVGENPRSSSGDVARYDPLQNYYAEIRHLKPLTREQEHKLALQYFETKDPKAGYRLVLANLRLVVMIAREYQRNAQNILDLVQEGNIGLLEAVKQFDPYKGVRFPSYAVYWIRAYMLRYLINNLRLVKLGTTQAQRKLFFNLQKERDKLEAEGFAPESKLLAERLKVKESEVIEMEQRLGLPDLSVDAPVGRQDDGQRLDLHSVLPTAAPNAEQVVAEEEFQQRLREEVENFKAGLDEKERAIIDERLFTEDPATLQTIAERFHLSRERIRQIESRLKENLKRHLSEKLQLGESGDVLIGGDEE